MTLPRLWAFLAVALPTLAALIAAMSTVDLTYQLRAGAQILSGQGIPSVDTWTFTAAGQPWFDQQWGAQVILAAVYQGGGWTGLVLLRAGLIGTIFGSVFLVAYGAGLAERSATILTLAAFVIAAPALALRPQLFGLMCFALVLLILSRREAQPRALWLIPLIVLAWANLHGTFFFGPLVVGLTWLADVRRGAAPRNALLAVTLLSLAATCVTPFGPTVWRYAAGLSVDPSVTGRITEWQRTSPTDVAGLLFYGSVAAVAGLLWWRRQSVDGPMLLWLAVFGAVGVYAVRGIPWWALAAVPVVARLLAAGLQRASPWRGTPAMRRLNVTVAGLMVLVGVALLPIWRPVDPATGTPAGLVTDAPAGVTASLRSVARSGDRLFNPQPWGSWIEFALDDLIVTVDSRVELFPVQVWADYEAVRVGAPGWQAILDRWDVTLVIVEPADATMVSRVVDAGWLKVSSDVSGTVLRRPG